MERPHAKCCYFISTWKWLLSYTVFIIEQEQMCLLCPFQHTVHLWCLPSATWEYKKPHGQNLTTRWARFTENIISVLGSPNRSICIGHDKVLPTEKKKDGSSSHWGWCHCVCSLPASLMLYTWGSNNYTRGVKKINIFC